MINLIANRYTLGAAAFAFFAAPIQLFAYDLFNQVNEVLMQVSSFTQ